MCTIVYNISSRITLVSSKFNSFVLRLFTVDASEGLSNENKYNTILFFSKYLFYLIFVLIKEK